MTKWYDLGNFTYDYNGESDTQYFEVEDLSQTQSDKLEENTIEELNDEREHKEGGSGEEGLNETVSIPQEINALTADSYDDFMNGFKFVAFRLLSNHGGSDYGCIYRLKVFGDAI